MEERLIRIEESLKRIETTLSEIMKMMEQRKDVIEKGKNTIDNIQRVFNKSTINLESMFGALIDDDEEEILAIQSSNPFDEQD